MNSQGSRLELRDIGKVRFKSFEMKTGHNSNHSPKPPRSPELSRSPEQLCRIWGLDPGRDLRRDLRQGGWGEGRRGGWTGGEGGALGLGGPLDRARGWSRRRDLRRRQRDEDVLKQRGSVERSTFSLPPLLLLPLHLKFSSDARLRSCNGSSFISSAPWPEHAFAAPTVSFSISSAFLAASEGEAPPPSRAPADQRPGDQGSFRNLGHQLTARPEEEGVWNRAKTVNGTRRGFL
ncbi:Mitotic Checkpoint Serine/Threonine-Protein Kinase Bub1 Beta [Manis pentadactyla]|nr:Mitotic Checkpoint Serine/Threonine-Protein Kinase Bub1 Beta [Manis pentadactyla]